MTGRAMAADRSRSAMLSAARQQFERHGFRGTTIRGIAADAGVSPSLVIKVFGTKSALYAESGASGVPIDGIEVPRSALGITLVRRIAQRAVDGVDEPWSAPSTTIRLAEHPELERAAVSARLLGWLAVVIGDTTPDRSDAAVVACLLAGFAEGIGVIGLAEGDCARDALTERYARLVQAEIDRARRA